MTNREKALATYEMIQKRKKKREIMNTIIANDYMFDSIFRNSKKFK